MLETLKQGLLITAVGMGIVFAMILVIWAIMALLVRLTNRPEQEETAEETASPEPAVEASTGDAAALAAAIAVAYALSAKPKTAFAGETQSIQTGSVWLTAGRAQQVAQQINRGRSA
ncbi:MAG: OadG family protein [Anaerolineaceae bacterium]|nr:OadG family protein [Chloroflexota bacterium]